MVGRIQGNTAFLPEYYIQGSFSAWDVTYNVPTYPPYLTYTYMYLVCNLCMLLVWIDSKYAGDYMII